MGITSLCEAISNGDMNKANELIATTPNIINQSNDKGMTPLRIAVGMYRKELVNTLIQKGANIHARDNMGFTPLHVASMHSDSFYAQILILNGADVNAKTNDGRTSLHLVFLREVASLLIQNGADVNAKDQVGFTPLHSASDKDNLDIATVLLANGAKVNSTDNIRQTPLHWAAWKSYSAIVKLLLSKGADVNAKDVEGFTPLYWATKPLDDIGQILLEHGPGYNAKREVVNMLLEHGGQGSTPDKIPATDDEKTLKMETIRLLGVDFPIASNVEEFCKMAADEGRCAMLINLKDYAQMWQAAFRYFNDKFGVSSRFMYGVTSAQLICLGCKLVFPRSYKFSLQGGYEGFGVVLGARAGFREFGQTARCPECSSGQACFAIDNPPAEEITQRDIDYICEYWHHLAQQWWKAESRTQAFCDVCGSPVLRDDGYLRINDLMCKHCCESHLGSDSLDKLRKNQSYFGEWELRKARYFIANK